MKTAQSVEDTDHARPCTPFERPCRLATPKALTMHKAVQLISRTCTTVCTGCTPVHHLILGSTPSAINCAFGFP
ncbi:hypothetical protein HanPI659440_Chr12g0467971 [Helianthus annuus]|nr:hypothetical protein HanPI659440_Chr12g0467971 [Helianthus annuus]